MTIPPCIRVVGVYPTLLQLVMGNYGILKSRGARLSYLKSRRKGIYHGNETEQDGKECSNGKGEQSNVTALATWISAESKGMKFNLPQDHVQERTMYEVGKRLFFMRGGPHDFACASCHGEDGKRIRLQDLPNLTKNPGDGVGFAAWPAYRVSNGQMWGMQQRLNDCYRQQRFPFPIYGSDLTVALSMYMAKNANGGTVETPGLKR